MPKTIVVKLVTRPTVRGKRTWQKVNLKKIYPEATVFILRWLPKGAKNYSYKTLGEVSLRDAEIARASFQPETAAAEPNKGRIAIRSAVDKYLDGINRGLTLKTLQAYHLALNSFYEHLAKTAPKEFMDEIIQGDLDEFRLVLIGQKYQDRSIGNILGNLHCFLIKLGFMVDAKLAKLLPGKLVPVRHQVPKKAPKQYNGELHKLMAASTPEDRELWDFLRKSGSREDEAAHAEITDVEAQ
jgi:hypothetical protein